MFKPDGYGCLKVVVHNCSVEYPFKKIFKFTRKKLKTQTSAAEAAIV